MSLIIILGIVAIITVGISVRGGSSIRKLVIANFVGVGFVAVAAAGVALFNAISSDWLWSAWALPWLVGSAILALLDLSCRYMSIRSRASQVAEIAASSSSPKSPWLAPAPGGALTVVPAWLVGVLLTIGFAVLSIRDFLWRVG